MERKDALVLRKLVNEGKRDEAEKTKKEFCEEQANRLARDSEGNLCYMATSIYNLMTTQKHWPQVEFRTTREQGQKFE